MVTLGLCMIVKNEEKVLHRCLQSVSPLVDEIIIVDTGSVDVTKKIAQEFTDNVHDFVWIDDFAAARNYSFSLSKCQYLMWLDADDVIEPKDLEEFGRIKAMLGDNPDTDIVMMKYNTGFDSLGNVTHSYYRERIVRNVEQLKWVGAVHEVIPLKGKLMYSEGAVSHRKIEVADPQRNLRIFEKVIADGKILDPREQFYYARELYYHKQYNKAIKFLKQVIDNDSAWIENRIDACKILSYCYYGIKKEGLALEALFKSFTLDVPRSEICCDIGYHFFDRSILDRAVYWYERALSGQRVDARGGFVQPDSFGFIPAIQLCVCHSRLNDIDKAIYYNELAATFKPSAEAVIKNRQYFQNLKKKLGLGGENAAF